jgi:hypothetical protein
MSSQKAQKTFEQFGSFQEGLPGSASSAKAGFDIFSRLESHRKEPATLGQRTN